MNDFGKYFYEVIQFSITVDNTLTGIEITNFADDSATEIYTIDGIRITSPERGKLYIIRKGTEVYKKVIR